MDLYVHVYLCACSPCVYSGAIGTPSISPVPIAFLHGLKLDMGTASGHCKFQFRRWAYIAGINHQLTAVLLRPSPKGMTTGYAQTCSVPLGSSHKKDLPVHVSLQIWHLVHRASTYAHYLCRSPGAWEEAMANGKGDAFSISSTSPTLGETKRSPRTKHSRVVVLDTRWHLTQNTLTCARYCSGTWAHGRGVRPTGRVRPAGPQEGRPTMVTGEPVTGMAMGKALRRQAMSSM
jgi:hypothetical protein